MSHLWTGNHRAPWHDYASRCIYHLTLMKTQEAPLFGKLAGSHHLPIGTNGSSYIAASKIGKAIKQTLRELHEIHPHLHLHQYALMPDHLHIILEAEDDLDESIGRKLAIFKVRVNDGAGGIQVFEHGFNDQILIRKRSLDAIYRYLKSNPYRLAVRRANPDFFQMSSGIVIDGMECQLYGNHHLLDNPFKEQIIVHRADSYAIFSSNRDRWLHTGLNGGVVVSPFISPREKSVRENVIAAGCRQILISNRPMAQREKPHGKNFDLCAQGLMLIIAPTTPMPMNRATCLKLNSLAKAIACNPLR